MHRHDPPGDRKVLRLTRRHFIAGIGAAGVATLGAACSIGKDAPPPDEVIVPAADVPEVDAPPFSSKEGKFHLVRTADGVLAMSSLCTHQNCPVPWRDAEGQFRCPCHDSLFDHRGVRIAGPAMRPLDLVAIEVAPSGDITVRPKERRQRQGYAPDQATPYPATSQRRTPRA